MTMGFLTWGMAIPFLGVCGFACVYFLGAKGFCTYGCPYGGFFFPADRLAVGRIRVTDACEHCGHCTAVCTSNVRVHEEVRDYGMVVDPGCMKTMDCISVCPNDALYFGFGTPALLARARVRDVKPGFHARIHDFSWPEEIGFFVLGVVLFLGFRGMLGQVPLLMAGGMAGVGVYLAWKLYQMLRIPSVRIQSLQLKLKGRVRPAGAAFGLLAGVMLAAGLWGAVRFYNMYAAQVLDARITTRFETVFSPGYQPTPMDKDTADRALAHLRRAGPWADGGYGWELDLEPTRRFAWLSAVAGRLDQAQAALLHGIRLGQTAKKEGAPQDLVEGLGQVLHLRGQSAEQVAEVYRGLVAELPGAATVHLALGATQLELGRPDEAAASVERALAARPGDARLISPAVDILMACGNAGRVAELLERAVAEHPESSAFHMGLGSVYCVQGKPEPALAELRRATEIDPKNAVAWARQAELLRAMGREDEALQAERKASALLPPRPKP